MAAWALCLERGCHPSLTFIPFIFSGQPMKPAEKEDGENLFLEKHTRNSY